MTGKHHVPAGQDRSGRRLTVEGVVPLDRKVRPGEVEGRFFIYEHRDVGRGGPPRHVHHAGEERIVLGPGESVLAPRAVPHGWANLAEAPASLIFLAQPAGTLEAFFEALDGRADIPWGELEALYEQHGMTLLGPPMAA